MGCNSVDNMLILVYTAVCYKEVTTNGTGPKTEYDRDEMRVLQYGDQGRTLVCTGQKGIGREGACFLH